MDLSMQHIWQMQRLGMDTGYKYTISLADDRISIPWSRLNTCTRALQTHMNWLINNLFSLSTHCRRSHSQHEHSINYICIYTSTWNFRPTSKIWQELLSQYFLLYWFLSTANVHNHTCSGSGGYSQSNRKKKPFITHPANNKEIIV